MQAPVPPPVQPPPPAPPPRPPPAREQENLQHQVSLKGRSHQRGLVGTPAAAVARELLAGNEASERQHRGKGGRGKGGRGRGGRGGRGTAAPAPAADMAELVQEAVQDVMKRSEAAAAAEAPAPALSVEEQAALEAKKRDRKEAKKLRRQSSNTNEGAGGAVLPTEPIAGAITGVRRCRSPADFLTLCRLGQGAFGRVMLVRWCGDGRPYAMKVVRVDEATQSQKGLSQLLVERRALIELAEAPHPLLAAALCCFRSARHLHFVMPFLPGGTLVQVLEAQPGGVLADEDARFYAAQITDALGELHSRGMLYLDLKQENIMLNARGDAILIDFGLVKCDVDVRRGQVVKRAGGTRCYLAPEAILGQPVGAPCDWWALGVLMFELLAGQLPFRGENDKALGVAICNARVRFPRVDGDAPADAPAADTPVSVDVSDAAADAPKADGVSGGGGGPISPNAMSMVRKLLTKKTDGRLGTNGVAEVKGHPFLAAFDWPGLADGTMRRPHPPVLASDVDVRYFARKHTSQGGAISAAEMDANAEAESLKAVVESEARRAELKASEERLAAAAVADKEAAVVARRTAAENAVEAAKAKEASVAEEAAAEAQKRVRAAQKKLRQSSDLAEQQAAGDKTLNKEQREKVAAIPKIEGELRELTESAAQREEELAAVRKKQAREAEATAVARRVGEAERADKAAKAREAEEEAAAKAADVAPKLPGVADLSEMLSVEKFAFVTPEWRTQLQ